MKEIIELLKNNLGKDVTISANYIDVSGTISNITEELVKLKIDKKRAKYIKLGAIYAIEGENLKDVDEIISKDIPEELIKGVRKKGKGLRVAEEYKKPKGLGKNEDGAYLGRIEEIGTSKDEDILFICNRRSNAWAFSVFTGYKQIGSLKVKKPHSFEEGDLIVVRIKDNEIVEAIKGGEGEKW